MSWGQNNGPPIPTTAAAIACVLTCHQTAHNAGWHDFQRAQDNSARESEINISVRCLGVFCRMNTRGFEMQNQPNPEPESKTKLFSTPILVMCIACLGMGFSLQAICCAAPAPTALQARSSAPDVAAPPPQAMGERPQCLRSLNKQAPHKMPHWTT